MSWMSMLSKAKELLPVGMLPRARRIQCIVSALRIVAVVVVVVVVASVVASASLLDDETDDDDDLPIQVFVLAGQSNMVGMGSIDHLDLLVRDDNNSSSSSSSSSSSVFDVIWDDTTLSYREREDVYIKNGDAHGKLTVSASAGYAGRNSFGPEVMFGWTVGDILVANHISSPRISSSRVLLIKTAWGGKSLAVDFRPPSAGEGNYGAKPIQYGAFYRAMILDIQDTLAHLDRYIPDYSTANNGRYELSGLVWFQGWNDMLNWDSVNEYGPNLVKFIRDVRLDLDAPNLPIGMSGCAPLQ
jgi:Carbohydrate esterase, sialic acid-specific acetylesterase